VTVQGTYFSRRAVLPQHAFRAARGQTL
jgi:hypothetical protein